MEILDPPVAAKIRARLMPAVEFDHDQSRAADDDSVEQKYREVKDSIQRDVDALVRKRALPLFG